jgi:hypothetical protein
VCGNGVDQLLIKAMRYQSLDNLSVVMIALNNFKTAVKKAFESKRNMSSVS